MPSRVTTAKMYRSLISNHIHPKWGSTTVKEVQPRPVELWLRELLLSPKSVAQHVADVKTEGSAKALTLTPELMERLKADRQRSAFTGPEDWVFASPHQIGRLPYSYTGVRRILQRAATAANLGRLSTPSFRHTYRSWLDAVGTGVAVQQKMMRHADIRTTFNVYGDVVTDEMTTAGIKV